MPVGLPYLVLAAQVPSKSHDVYCTKCKYVPTEEDDGPEEIEGSPRKVLKCAVLKWTLCVAEDGDDRSPSLEVLDDWIACPRCSSYTCVCTVDDYQFSRHLQEKKHRCVLHCNGNLHFSCTVNVISRKLREPWSPTRKDCRHLSMS